MLNKLKRFLARLRADVVLPPDMDATLTIINGGESAQRRGFVIVGGHHVVLRRAEVLDNPDGATDVVHGVG